MAQLAYACFCISHVNAVPEHDFSINKKVLEDRTSLNEKTIEAVRLCDSVEIPYKSNAPDICKKWTCTFSQLFGNTTRDMMKELDLLKNIGIGVENVQVAENRLTELNKKKTYLLKKSEQKHSYKSKTDSHANWHKIALYFLFYS